MKIMLAVATSVSITLLASGLGLAQTDDTRSSSLRPTARDTTNTPGSSRQASWYTHQENNFDAQIGLASYYRPSQQIASGRSFKSSAMTAAHRSLPFGTRVRVTRIDTGNSVEVTINDRGPFVAGRIIDLSRVTAGRSWPQGLLGAREATLRR